MSIRVQGRGLPPSRPIIETCKTIPKKLVDFLANHPDMISEPPTKKRKTEKDTAIAADVSSNLPQCIDIFQVAFTHSFEEASLPEIRARLPIRILTYDKHHNFNFTTNMKTGVTSALIESDKIKLFEADLYAHDNPNIDNINLAISTLNDLQSNVDASVTRGQIEILLDDRALYLVIKVQLPETIDLAHVPSKCRPRERDDKVQARFFPTKPMPNYSGSPLDFYGSIPMPASSPPDERFSLPVIGSRTLDAALDLSPLNTKLYPFQKRTLRWMLLREGMRSNHTAEDSSAIPAFFSLFYDSSNTAFYYDPVLRVATRQPRAFLPTELLKGGLLCEEMGLGKTVEIIALISINCRDMEFAAKSPIFDIYHEYRQMRPLKGTLIICTPAILLQWLGELSQHAPDLKVTTYLGLAKNPHLSSEEILENLVQFDVVLSTYAIIGKELVYTQPAPLRSMRRAPLQPRPVSPLVLGHWHRVIIDEAQTVESGVTKPAQVAKCIPRENAWAVTGTPLRTGISDLFGLVNFLRLEPFCTRRYAWDRLCTKEHSASFRKLIETIAIRHTKQSVKNELHLPGQSRYIITVPFTPVEQQYYQNLFTEMCDDLRYNKDTGAFNSNLDMRVSLDTMQKWLVRLRQCCLHPEIGSANRRKLGNKDGPLKTVAEVLDVMIDQAAHTEFSYHRTLLLTKLQRGQFYELSPRAPEAIELYHEVVQDAEVLVKSCEKKLMAQNVKKPTDEVHEVNNRKIASRSDDKVNNEVDSQRHIGVLRSRHRLALELLHKAVLSKADAVFQQKERQEAESEDWTALNALESSLYDRAKQIRKQLLSETFDQVTELMQVVKHSAQAQEFVAIPPIDSYNVKGGIESRSIFEDADALGEALDTQAETLNDLREKVIELLLHPLVDDEGEELTGAEYEESANLQNTIYVYVSILRSIVEDRFDALTGGENALVANEAKLAVRLAKNDECPDPEQTIRLYELRSEIKPSKDLGSLRGLISRFRQLTGALRHEHDGENSLRRQRAMAELALLDNGRTQIQEQLAEQLKIIDELRREVDLMNSLSNHRLEYYRQLQAISDDNAKMELPTEPSDRDWKHHDSLIDQEKRIERKIEIDSANRRYLENLQENSTDRSKIRPPCVICHEEIVIGTLTSCGHEFCKDCLSIWFSDHRRCPLCKQRLTDKDMHTISYAPRLDEESTISQDQKSTKSPTRNKQSSIYSDLSPEILAQIQAVKTGGVAYGSKVDTICKHLIWLRDSDPGTKSIIFTQYKDFVTILTQAFTSCRIGYSTIDQGAKGIEEFNISGIEVFILHGKAQSSGLNLIQASHVFLCEPLINTAIELQIIARVDRIGQHQKTSVYQYLVENTVEESIHEISVRRRMQHIANGTSGSNDADDVADSAGMPNVVADDDGSTIDEDLVEAANTRELEQVAVRSALSRTGMGGEHVDEADLWQCLFGHARGSSSFVHDAPWAELAASAAEKRALAARAEAVPGGGEGSGSGSGSGSVY